MTNLLLNFFVYVKNDYFIEINFYTAYKNNHIALFKCLQSVPSYIFSLIFL